METCISIEFLEIAAPCHGIPRRMDVQGPNPKRHKTIPREAVVPLPLVETTTLSSHGGIGNTVHFLVHTVIPNLYSVQDKIAIISACHVMFGSIFFGTFTKMFMQELMDIDVRRELLQHIREELVERHGSGMSVVGDWQRIAFDLKNPRLAMEISASELVKCLITKRDTCVVNIIEKDARVLRWFSDSCRQSQYFMWKDDRRNILSRIAGSRACHGDFSLARTLMKGMMRKTKNVVMTGIVDELAVFRDGVIDAKWCLKAQEELMDLFSSSSPSAQQLNERFIEGIATSPVCDAGSMAWIAIQILLRKAHITWGSFSYLLDKCSKMGDESITMTFLQCVDIFEQHQQQQHGRGEKGKGKRGRCEYYTGIWRNDIRGVDRDSIVIKAVMNAKSPALDTWLFSNKPSGYGLGGERTKEDKDWTEFTSICTEYALIANAQGRHALSSLFVSACTDGRDVKLLNAHELIEKSCSD